METTEKENIMIQELPFLKISRRKHIGDYEFEDLELSVRSYNPESCVMLMDYLLKSVDKVKK